MTEIKIPKDAKQVRSGFLNQNIDEWFCPDCGAHGSYSTLDYISEPSFDNDNPRVTFVCAECFEENLYVTYTKD